ncbi:hypothetical protein AB4Z54_25180, partial [Streptomyces sp. MCAF7]
PCFDAFVCVIRAICAICVFMCVELLRITVGRRLAAERSPGSPPRRRPRQGRGRLRDKEG